MAKFNHKPLAEKPCLSFTWHPPDTSPDLSSSTAVPPLRIPTSPTHILSTAAKYFRLTGVLCFPIMLPQDTQFTSHRSSHHALKETKQRETGKQRVCKIICHEQPSKFHDRDLFSHKVLIFEWHKWQNTESGKKAHKKSLASGRPGDGLPEKNSEIQITMEAERSGH